MAYPIATTPYAGSNQSPAYTGNFIPEIWSGKLIEKFYPATVLGAIANTDYEGEITNKGDKVRIRARPTIAISDYEVNQDLTVQRPSVAGTELNIDKGKYFNLALDDVMKIQSDINLLNEWAEDAAEQMKVAVDSQVLAALLATSDIAATNRGNTAGAISAAIRLGLTTTPLFLHKDGEGTGDGSTNVNSMPIVDALVNYGLVLDEANIPETGRWVVLPAWACAMIKKSDLKDASITGDGTSILRNGRLGMIDRFTVYMSNLTPQGVAGGLAAGEAMSLFGTSGGLTFASQFVKTETLRSERSFSSLLRGLQVYGFKVVNGVCLGRSIIAAG